MDRPAAYVLAGDARLLAAIIAHQNVLACVVPPPRLLAAPSR